MNPLRRLHAVGKLTPWLQVNCAPILTDNYFYTIKDTANAVCTLVDPADSDAAIAGLQDSDCELTGIWTTHHHWDHAGGNEALCASFPGLEVLAPSDSAPIAGRTQEAQHGTPLRMHASLPAVGTTLQAGVHTKGHVMYLVQPPDGALHAHGVAAPCGLFAGDVLFPQGAGRFFEGTAQGFWTSVRHSLMPLPGGCMVFTGHDYSRGNAAFAGAAGLHTLPWRQRGTLPPSVTLLGLEAGHNPFLLPMATPVLDAVAAHCRGVQSVDSAGAGTTAAAETLLARRFTPAVGGSPEELWAALQEQVADMSDEEHTAAVRVLAYLRAWKNAL